MEKYCIVRGCNRGPVCKDEKGYTFQQNAGFLTELEDGDWSYGGPDGQGLLRTNGNETREIWYCQRHATQYLFPLIDAANGNTFSDILHDFAVDGML